MIVGYRYIEESHGGKCFLCEKPKGAVYNGPKGVKICNDCVAHRPWRKEVNDKLPKVKS